MSALRMMAYGVWIDPGTLPTPVLTAAGTFDDHADERAKRTMQRKLVREELKKVDMLIQPTVKEVNKGGRRQFRASGEHFALYGPRSPNVSPKGWITRGIIAEGTFKECCLAAVKFLEPDNKVLNDETQ